MKLTVSRDRQTDTNSQAYADMFASRDDWEILGLVMFKGRIDALVFVARRYFHQVSLSVFDGACFVPPPAWRVLTGHRTALPGVELILAHAALTSDPDLLARCVDMDEGALEALLRALDATA